MATDKQIQEALNKIAGEMSGFIAASLVDLDSGLTLRAPRNDGSVLKRR